MKSRIGSFVLGGMLVATQLPAQVSFAPLAPVIGVDPVSTYLFRGQDVTEAAAIQPFASVSFGNSGLSLGVWSSFAVADRDHVVALAVPRGSLDEVDVTAAFNRAFGPAAFGVGYIAYLFPAESQDYKTQEVFGTLGIPGVPLAPTVSVFYDFDGGELADAPDLIEGVYASFGIGQRFPIGLPLDVGANLGWTNQEAIRADPAINDFNLWAGVPIPFQGLTVTPTVGFTHLFNDAAIAPDGEGTVWAKIQLRLP
jgi:hypothetical protein